MKMKPTCILYTSKHHRMGALNLQGLSPERMQEYLYNPVAVAKSLGLPKGTEYAFIGALVKPLVTMADKQAWWDSAKKHSPKEFRTRGKESILSRLSALLVALIRYDIM